MSSGLLYRNFTFEVETLKWWLFMRTTPTGSHILLRGVWKFAMAWAADSQDMCFHVVEDNSDEWTIVPELEVDFRRLPRDQDNVISESHRWW